MPPIVGSVGRNGANYPQDVRLVQQLLNKHLPQGQFAVQATGIVSARTLFLIDDFQRRVVRIAPNGRVDPLGPTLRLLLEDAAVRNQDLSGAAWWHTNAARYGDSIRVDDLEADFRGRVIDFLGALNEAGATVGVVSTRWSKQRGYLMHYSWQVANSRLPAAAVPPMPGVDIQWDHGDATRSLKAAQEMVGLFGMGRDATLTSPHFDGKAIDLDITWQQTLRVKQPDGTHAEITSLPRNGGNNTELHQVGAGFGVYKLVTDPPYWSSDGR
jgi:hypothetical protein